jgi:hypothetical protein
MAAVIREVTRAELRDHMYRRLGPRYPRAAVAAVPQLAYTNVFVGLAVLALFADMSSAEFGDRDERTVAAAWKTCASFPRSG